MRAGAKAPALLHRELCQTGVKRTESDPIAFERITVDPHKMRGLPIVRDTRVTVAAVVGQLAARRTVEQILAD
jgi:uncharacterized protein (DUF433 family)